MFLIYRRHVVRQNTKSIHIHSHSTNNVQQSPIKAGLSNSRPSRPTHEECSETRMITQSWLMYAHTYIHTYTHTSKKVYTIQNFTYRVTVNCNLVCYFLQKVETNCIQLELPRTRNVKILACFITCFITSKTTRLAEKRSIKMGASCFSTNIFKFSLREMCRTLRPTFV